ncbi:hypothetical protein LY78DRAFT_502660 [Colletotrichum sublineola]|nr:hypothetical protein LY78DRAFT_502660 [Colletotrichum sublineola]
MSKSHPNLVVHRGGPSSTHRRSVISSLQRPPRHAMSRPLTPGSAHPAGTSRAGTHQSPFGLMTLGAWFKVPIYGRVAFCGSLLLIPGKPEKVTIG